MERHAYRAPAERRCRARPAAALGADRWWDRRQRLSAFAFFRAWTLESAGDGRWGIWSSSTPDASVLIGMIAALPAAALGAAFGWLLAPRSVRASDERRVHDALLASRAWQATWWPLLAASLVGPQLLGAPLSASVLQWEGASMAPVLVRYTTHLHVIMVLTAALYTALYEQQTRVARYPIVAVSACALVSILVPGFGFFAVVVTPIVWIAGVASLLPIYLWTHQAITSEVAWLKDADVDTAVPP